MNAAGPEILSIFGEALECPTDEERATYLDRVCGADAGLRSQLAALIAANAKLGHFLEGSPATNRLDSHSQIEQPGTIIGPYKLLEQIGEGGMGLVFMAEQTQPVRRKVALKVLKPGMDTRQVVARFEAERQALALMGHPNIAQIFDAGTTGEPSRVSDRVIPADETRGLTPLGSPGRPYFVMELVRGVPITEFCDKRRLTTRQRLELFVTVCHAVQHAHQKGIIHRDLKPSNILVTLHDTIGVPKIIDFGIAKATKQPLTERSLFTHFSQMIGTPLYMSPEQAEMNGLDVDTRSDVYALGVLLYELLTGTTPFASERLKQIGFDEMRRVIREEEPPRPSQRVSTLEAAACSTLSEQRGTDVRTFASMLRGELDWIVIKALEKDRNRRYESASAFAADVQRFLNDEKVEACPPSARYRLRKFARRNKVVLTTFAMVASALLLGTTVSIWQAVEATGGRRLADERRQQAEATADLLQSVFQNLNPDMENKNGLDLKAQLLANLDDAADRLEREGADPLTQARLQNALGYALLGLGEAHKAVTQLQRSVEQRQAKLGPDHQDTLTSMDNLAVAYRVAGKFDVALTLQKRTLEKRRAMLPTDHPDTLDSIDGLSALYRKIGRLDLAIPLIQELLEKTTAIFGPDDGETILRMRSLGAAYRENGNLHLAIPLLQQALEKAKIKFGPHHRHTLNSMNSLAVAYTDAGKHDLAVPLLQQTLEKYKAAFGPDHPTTLNNMHNLGVAYRKGRQLDLAVPMLQQTLELAKTKLGSDDPLMLSIMNTLTLAYEDGGQWDLAVPLFEQLLDMKKIKPGPDHPVTLRTMRNLAYAYEMAGSLDQAEALLKDLLERERKKERPNALGTSDALRSLGGYLLEQKRFVDAEPLLRELVEIRQTQLPDHWNRYHSLSLLGDALLGQRNYPAAEPLLLKGYEGMKKRETQIPSNRQVHLTEAIERIVRLYEATGEPEKAKMWGDKLDPQKKRSKTSSSSPPVAPQ